MARPSVCSHVQRNSEWEDHQSVHTYSGTGNGKTINLFTRTVEQGMGRPSICSHVQWNREWQDHQSVHTAAEQGMARPSVCSHCSGTGNGKTISVFTRAKCSLVTASLRSSTADCATATFRRIDWLEILNRESHGRVKQTSLNHKQ